MKKICIILFLSLGVFNCFGQLRKFSSGIDFGFQHNLYTAGTTTFPYNTSNVSLDIGFLWKKSYVITATDMQTGQKQVTGYVFGSHMVSGLRVSYEKDFEDIKFQGTVLKNIYYINNSKISWYDRVYLTPGKQFSIFFEEDLSYSSMTYDEFPANNENSTVFSIVPGFNYFLNQDHRFSVNAVFGNFYENLNKGNYGFSFNMSTLHFGASFFFGKE